MTEGEQAKLVDSEDLEGFEGGRLLRGLDAWAPWLIVVLGVLFFSGPLFSDRNFYFRDIFNFHYPLRKVVVDAWGRSEFPLWNPFLYFGQPMLANPNYMALYPTNLFHLIFPFDYAFKLHFIVHPLLAGLGLYYLQRRLGILPVAALGGAIAYEFSGTLLSFLNLYNILPAVALVPWIGWAFTTANQERRLRYTLALGGLLALQIIALEPLTTQCALLLLAGLGAMHLIQAQDRKRAALRVLGNSLGGILLGIGFAAVQILPALEMLRHSVRGSGSDYSIASRWSMHPMDFLNAFVPNLFGDPFSIGYATSWGEAYHHGDLGILVSFFIGSAVLLLASLSIISQRTHVKKVLLALGLTGTLLSLGSFAPVYPWLWEHVPWFRLGRYPAKYFMLVTLVLCVLAALGLEVLLKNSELRTRISFTRAVGAIGLIMGAILIGSALHWWLNPAPLAGWLRSQVEPQMMGAKAFIEIQAQLLSSLFSSGIFLAIGGGLMFLPGSRIRPVFQGGLWLVLVVAELFPAGLRLMPLIPGAMLDFVPEIERYLVANEQEPPLRVISPNWRPAAPNRLHVPNRSLAWTNLYERMTGQTMGGVRGGIQYSLDRSIDLLNTADSEELYRRCLMLPEPDRLGVMQKVNSPVVLSIGAISGRDLQPIASFDTRSDYRLYAYKLAGALPRAYFAAKTLFAPEHAVALEMMLHRDLQLENAVILEKPAPSADISTSNPGNAVILSYRDQKVTCETNSEAPGYVVLLDSFYPGWQAAVDGREAEILRANYCFRAVRVPEGKHRIEFVYRPARFVLGLAITLLTVAGALACIVIAVAQRKHGRRTPQADNFPPACAG